MSSTLFRSCLPWQRRGAALWQALNALRGLELVR